MNCASGSLLLRIVGVEVSKPGPSVDCDLEGEEVVSLDVRLAGQSASDIVAWVDRVSALPRFAAIPGF